jgi:hypothetical protein
MKTQMALVASAAVFTLLAACATTPSGGGNTHSTGGANSRAPSSGANNTVAAPGPSQFDAVLRRFTLPTLAQMKSEPRPAYDPVGRPLAAEVMKGATKEWSQEKPLQLGIQWILDNQQEDGHWGHFLPWRPADIMLGGYNSWHAFGNASTGLCVMALLLQPPSKEIDQAIVRGYEYLAKTAPLTGRPSPSVFYSVWAHTYLVEAFCRGLADPRVKDLVPAMRERCKDELASLLLMQNCDGGFGYYDFGHAMVHPTSEYSTSFNAAAALVAMKLAKENGFTVPQNAMDSCVGTLARMRLPNGAYAYSRDWVYRPVTGPSCIEGSLCRATAGNYALYHFNRDVKVANVRAGLDNLFAHHDYVEIARQREYPHETWFQNAPYYYYFGHYYAALSLTDLNAGDRADYAGKLSAFVGITQDADGSFWDYPLYGYTKAYGTAYGVLVLSLCKAQQTAAVAAKPAPAAVTK